MPRTLPWLKNGGTPARSRPSGSRRDDKAGRDGPKATESDAGHGSTSPAQSPGRSSGDDEGMREGYDADDIWMMVEDEFLATAQLHTRHLHHAEYVRLQKEAEQREEGMPSHVAHPIPGFVPQHRSIQRKARRRESSCEADDVAINDPTLAFLMDSPRKQPAPLKREKTDMTLTPSRARVFKAAPSGSGPDDDETDDDLDAPVSRYAQHSRPAKPWEAANERGHSKVTSGHRVTEARVDVLGYKHAGIITSADGPFEGYEDHGKDKVAKIIAKRKMKAKDRQDAERRTNDSTTEIPTFLF